MSINPSACKIGSNRMLIRRLEKECIDIFLENPTCMENESEKEELIALAISHIEAKFSRCKSNNASYNTRSTILFTLAVQEFEEAPDDDEKKKCAKKVTQQFLKLGDEELMSIPEEIREKAFSIACTYFTEL